MKNFRLGVIGHGFVGKATDLGFKDDVDRFIVDPKYDTTIKDLENFDPDCIFLCVPTPMKSDGSQDSKILENVIYDISESSLCKKIVILKSTILPEKIKKITSLLEDFVYNPEFLTEKNAANDFINSDFILLGGEKKVCIKVSEIYKKYTKCETDNFIYTDFTSASLIKYTINSYLASKVIFFNEIKKIFDSSTSQESWENFISYVSSDKRIGTSHMMVPGHDGKLGFGGACFTKDTAAIYKHSLEIGKELTLLKKVIDINNSIRSSYPDLDDREIDQNVNYKFNE